MKEIKNFTLINVVRNKDYIYGFKDGKTHTSLIVVEKGEMIYSFKNETIRISRGNVLYIPAKTPYTATYLENETTVNIFGFECEEELFFKPVIKSNISLPQNFFHIAKENLSNSFFVAARTYDLLYILQQSTDITPLKYKKILPAIKEIDRKYFENHQISYYAKMCSMCESNLRRLFKEYTGLSLIDYRNKIRLKEAKKLIDSGEYTVVEAAYETGFNNMSFFYKVYNRGLCLPTSLS